MTQRCRKTFSELEQMHIISMFNRNKPINDIAKSLNTGYYRVKNEIIKYKKQKHDNRRISKFK